MTVTFGDIRSLTHDLLAHRASPEDVIFAIQMEPAAAREHLEGYVLDCASGRSFPCAHGRLDLDDALYWANGFFAFLTERWELSEPNGAYVAWVAMRYLRCVWCAHQRERWPAGGHAANEVVTVEASDGARHGRIRVRLGLESGPLDQGWSARCDIDTRPGYLGPTHPSISSGAWCVDGRRGPIGHPPTHIWRKREGQPWRSE